ncbi:MAG: hypothetical protein K8T26_17275 [Lentisphaerae bacterium]|nr:hypothetical protein [Lentisphaerota bacterium]
MHRLRHLFCVAMSLGLWNGAVPAHAQGTLAPDIANLGPTSVTAHAAVAQVELLSTGAAPTQVWIYWGDEDGGTNQAGWDAGVPLDWQPPGPLATGLSGLVDVKTYYYRGYASNAFGEAWAPDAHSFTTPLDFLAIGGTNDIGENMDFEDALTPRAGFPYVVWDWDGHNYVSVGKDGALRPMRGNLMMEAGSTTRPWESNYAVYHDVFNRHDPPFLDFLHYREAITNGTARFTFTFHYNRVSSAFDPLVDTMVFGQITFYNEGNQELYSLGWPREAHFASDNDPATWEAATVSGPLPLSAVRVRIWLGWYEDVSNEQSAGQEFRGNYFDNIQFALIFPILKLPDPTGGLVIVK